MTTQVFECKVRYTKTIENDQIKRVCEQYLVEALTFTEAEAHFLKEIEPFVSGGEYEVSDIKKARISELFTSQDGNDDRWFRIKVAFLTLDEKTGQEKRTSHTMLQQAADLKTAIRHLDDNMKGTLADYIITAVTETAIMDFFPYKVEKA